MSRNSNPLLIDVNFTFRTMAGADYIMPKLLLRLHGLPQMREYECSSWTQVSGGTTNLIYRGTLQHHLAQDDGLGNVQSGTIIIKHAMANVPGNEDFWLDVHRCEFEVAMLQALADFSNSNTPTSVVVKIPRLYLFNQETNTQILEDLHHTTDLKTILHSSTLNIRSYPGGSAFFLGHALGSWLRSFHEWGSAAEQAPLRLTIARNRSMRKLKCQITYDSFLGILQLYPQIVEGHMETLQSVRDAMTAEFQMDCQPTESDEGRGLIHGDFWSGNILIPNISSQEANQAYIIDWEFAQLGHRAIDVGGMLADLYERKHFRDVDAAIEVMKGFMDGYGRMTDDMAFRTCIHAGVHLICWHIRRNPSLPLPAPLDKVISPLKLGRDLVMKGWEKDRLWFESSFLGPLFTLA